MNNKKPQKYQKILVKFSGLFYAGDQDDSYNGLFWSSSLLKLQEKMNGSKINMNSEFEPNHTTAVLHL